MKIGFYEITLCKIAIAFEPLHQADGERELGELLFDRGRQGYIPSKLALELASHAERIDSKLQEARAAANKAGGEPAGVLRITTIDTVLHCLILPLLAYFAQAYSAIQLVLITSNMLVNLSQRDGDVAIRATRKPLEHVVGVKLGILQSAVFASRDYLLHHDARPQLQEMDWIALDESLPDHPSHKWRQETYPKLVPATGQ